MNRERLIKRLHKVAACSLQALLDMGEFKGDRRATNFVKALVRLCEDKGGKYGAEITSRMLDVMFFELSKDDPTK